MQGIVQGIQFGLVRSPSGAFGPNQALGRAATPSKTNTHTRMPSTGNYRHRHECWSTRTRTRSSGGRRRMPSDGSSTKGAALRGRVCERTSLLLSSRALHQRPRLEWGPLMG